MKVSDAVALVSTAALPGAFFLRSYLAGMFTELLKLLIKKLQTVTISQLCTINSGVECHLDMVEVIGSNPISCKRAAGSAHFPAALFL